MPLQSASTLESSTHLRAMFLGFAKTGKTTAVIKSATQRFGKGAVICCSTKEHLQSAQDACPEGWDFVVVKDIASMDQALKDIRRACKEGVYKWVLLDDFNFYADEVEAVMKLEHKDGYKTYPAYKNHLRNVIMRLFDLPDTHVLTTMHYVELSDGEIDGQAPKKGPGIVPLLTGQAKAIIPGLFLQVVFMEKLKNDKRVFYVNPAGVWGAGCNNVRGTHEIDADVGKLFDLLTKPKEAQ